MTRDEELHQIVIKLLYPYLDDGNAHTISMGRVKRVEKALLAWRDRCVEEDIKKVSLSEKSERFDYNWMKSQRVENYDYYDQSLKDAPVSSPERLVAYISYLSPW